MSLFALQVGFEMCGLESKHADHKQAIAEVST